METSKQTFLNLLRKLKLKLNRIGMGERNESWLEDLEPKRHYLWCNCANSRCLANSRNFKIKILVRRRVWSSYRDYNGDSGASSYRRNSTFPWFGLESLG